MKILIGTKNPAKARELGEFLGQEFEVLSLKDFPEAPDVEEVGKTFEENALLKANAYHEFSGLPTVADDGGFEIDFLGGEPGVLSRRWPDGEEEPGKPGREKTDEEMVDIALKKLRGVPEEKRVARLTMVGAFVDGKRIFTAKESIEGLIPETAAPIKEEGFPFRAILFIPKFGKLFQDLTQEEHEAINHRRRVCLALSKKIKEEYGK